MAGLHNIIKISVLSSIFAFLAACGSGDFNYGKVTSIIQSAPMHLDAEYVTLTDKQIECGIHEDLWDPPADAGGHSVARLKAAGRNLKFSDDVSLGDMKSPYVQVRGDFTLSVISVQSDREGPVQGSKLVDVRLGVPVSHTCFPDPLPMMGVHKGNFSQDDPPELLFKFNNGWTIEKIVH